MGLNFAAPPPSSPLSAQERALIDAAVAEGKVKVIPRGVSGVSELAPATINPGSYGRPTDYARAKAHGARRATKTLRKAQVAHMRREGMTVCAIAVALGWSQITIRNDIAELKREGRA
jgi:DNA-binding NarL/FixJ family response regulator